MNTTSKSASKQSWIALLFLWLIFAMNANGRELFNRVLPGIIDTYNINANTAGLIGTLSALGMFLASIPLSSWADRGSKGWKRKYRMAFLSLGYLVFMVFNGLSAFTGTFTMVLIWQFLRGVCSGPGEACEVGAVAEWWPKEKNGFALGLHHAAYPWGSALGGVLVSGIIAVYGIENWRYTYIAFPIIGFVIFALFWKWSTAKNYELFVKDTQDKGMTIPIADIEHNPIKEKKNHVHHILNALKNPNISVISIVCLLCQFAYISLMFWMTPYLTFYAGYSPAAAASLSVIYAITGGLGQICWGAFADKFGAKRSLVICCIWLVFAFYFMRYINISMGMLIFLQLLLGCCSNAVYPLFYKVVADSSEQGTVVTSNGILTTFMFLGASFATFVTGWLIDLGGGWESIDGYMTGLYCMVGAQVIAFILVLLFTRESNGPNLGKDFALISLKSCNLESDK
ncbi:MFS transporter [Necropsobacter rosorum]|uniref:MFS transporter n=1 Tax=Necropsobacter rosorum TaxID=908285 RepID=UPI0006924EBF